MRRTSAFLAALLMGAATVVAGTPQTAAAQTYGLRQTVGGSGRLTISGGTDDELREVRVDLRDGGSARLEFRGRRGPHTFDGRWSERRDGEVELTLSGREEGENARLSGSLTLDGRSLGRRRGENVRRIDLDGYAGRKRVRIDFRSDGRGPDDGNGGGADRIRSLSSSQKGDGRLTFTGRDERRIDSARVELRSDGRAEVVFLNGRDRDTFTGRWDQPGNSDNIRLTLTGEFGRIEATANGTLNLRTRDRGRFDRIELNGRAGGRSFRIRFTAN